MHYVKCMLKEKWSEDVNWERRGRKKDLIDRKILYETFRLPPWDQFIPTDHSVEN